MKARIVEMVAEKGFGKLELADGRLMAFDVSVSRMGVPEVGASAEVVIGPSRLGGEKVIALELIPTWGARRTLPFMVLRDHGGTLEVFFLVDGQKRRQSLARESQPRLRSGETGSLVLEKKLGARDFTDTRVVAWQPGDFDDARQQLLAAFHQVVRDSWETWDGEDGCHCDDHRNELRSEVSLALDLGLDAAPMLVIKDWDVDGARATPRLIKLERAAQ